MRACVCVDTGGVAGTSSGAVGPRCGARVCMCIGKEEWESERRHGLAGFEAGRERNENSARGQKGNTWDSIVVPHRSTRQMLYFAEQTGSSAVIMVWSLPFTVGWSRQERDHQCTQCDMYPNKTWSLQNADAKIILRSNSFSFNFQTSRGKKWRRTQWTKMSATIPRQALPWSRWVMRNWWGRCNWVVLRL